VCAVRDIHGLGEVPSADFNVLDAQGNKLLRSRWLGDHVKGRLGGEPRGGGQGDMVLVVGVHEGSAVLSMKFLEGMEGKTLGRCRGGESSRGEGL